MDCVQKHRGPDDSGLELYTTATNLSLGLGHQRLSILDLSKNGHQPMISPDGRFALILNAEIYNYKELARELEGEPALQISNGDTAVVLAAIGRWGEDAFARFNGMWSIVCFDRQKNKLILSRDPLGQKPLYYYRAPDAFIIASEIKTILSVVAQKFDLNTRVIANYLRHSIADVDEETFFDGIFALPPSSFASIDLSDLPAAKVSAKRYWQHPVETSNFKFNPSISPKMLRDQFMSAVELHLRSDVPVGVLLSGGIDSSAILAAAARIGGVKNLRALSVVSSNAAVDESNFINLAATHIGCELHKVNLSQNGMEILDLLPQACWQSDQPLVSLSTVAHLKLMRRAQALGFKVLLNGQGADEQLGGYGKFLWFYLKQELSSFRLDRALSMLGGCIKNGTVLPDFKLREAKRYLRIFREPMFRSYAGPALAEIPPLDVSSVRTYAQRELDDLRRFSLPVLLHREDRMSMASSIEMRVPFLDKDLVELVAHIPPSAKLRAGWTKHIFRKAVEDMLPAEIVWRRDKKGFTIPEQYWFQNDYREAVETLFTDPHLLSTQLGLVNPAGVRAVYKRFLKGDPLVNYKDILNPYCLEIFIRQFSSYLRCEHANLASSYSRTASNAS